MNKGVKCDLIFRSFGRFSIAARSQVLKIQVQQKVCMAAYTLRVIWDNPFPFLSSREGFSLYTVQVLSNYIIKLTLLLQQSAPQQWRSPVGILTWRWCVTPGVCYFHVMLFSLSWHNTIPILSDFISWMKTRWGMTNHQMLLHFYGERDDGCEGRGRWIRDLLQEWGLYRKRDCSLFLK